MKSIFIALLRPLTVETPASAETRALVPRSSRSGTRLSVEAILLTGALSISGFKSFRKSFRFCQHGTNFYLIVISFG